MRYGRSVFLTRLGLGDKNNMCTVTVPIVLSDRIFVQKWYRRAAESRLAGNMEAQHESFRLDQASLNACDKHDMNGGIRLTSKKTVSGGMEDSCGKLHHQIPNHETLKVTAKHFSWQC